MKFNRLNLRSLVAVVTCLAVLSVLGFGCKKEKEEEILSETLTVKQIVLSGANLKSVAVADEKGNPVPFPDNPNNWFENVSVKDITIPAGSIITLDPSSGNIILLTKLKFDFKVDGNDYSFPVGPGTKFVVRKTKTGKYNLLLEETFNLSQP